MRRFIINIFVLLILTSCEKNLLDGFTSTGKIITEKRDMLPVKRIFMHDDIKLILRQDTCYRLEVEGGENIIDNYVTDINPLDSSLTIKNLNTVNWLRDFRSERNVYLTIPYNQDSLIIDYYSSGGIISEQTINLDTLLDISVWEGAGSIELDIKCRRGSFGEHSGTTNWQLKGRCINAYVHLAGYGLMSMEKIHISNIFLRHYGSNDMLIAPTKILYGEITGIGKVKCFSTPMDTVICTPPNSPNLIFVK